MTDQKPFSEEFYKRVDEIKDITQKVNEKFYAEQEERRKKEDLAKQERVRAYESEIKDLREVLEAALNEPVVSALSSVLRRKNGKGIKLGECTVEYDEDSKDTQPYGITTLGTVCYFIGNKTPLDAKKFVESIRSKSTCNPKSGLSPSRFKQELEAAVDREINELRKLVSEQ